MILVGLGLAMLVFGTSGNAGENVVKPEMVGPWSGGGRIIVAWCSQTNLPMAVRIEKDGKVTGKVGDATLKNGRFKSNRGFVGRKLSLKTDYIITGDLEGPIVAAEGISRSGVNIPLNWTGNGFKGGLHTTGNKFGGKKAMILSAGMDLKKGE